MKPIISIIQKLVLPLLLVCDQGQQFDVEIEYPSSFNIHDAESDIAQLKIASETNPSDPRIKAAIDAKVLEWLDLDEEELAALVVIPDETTVLPDDSNMDA